MCVLISSINRHLLKHLTHNCWVNFKYSVTGVCFVFFGVHINVTISDRKDIRLNVCLIPKFNYFVDVIDRLRMWNFHFSRCFILWIRSFGVIQFNVFCFVDIQFIDFYSTVNSFPGAICLTVYQFYPQFAILTNNK